MLSTSDQSSSAPTQTSGAAAQAASQEHPRAQVLIIGAGINGMATFRDLALQGVDVALVDKGDYVSGASAASSHMIHGGVRYLENGEFRLVKESVEERNSLHKIAPHYGKPLKTTIPIYSTFSGVLAAPMRFFTHKQGAAQERGALLIKIGMMLYDSFSRDGGSVPRHEFLGRKASLKHLPQLNPALKYTATYYDASMHDPERLALDVLADGLAAGPHARSANYIEAVGMDAAGVRLRNTVTGAEFSFAADIVVDTSGPWTDLTNTTLAHHAGYTRREIELIASTESVVHLIDLGAARTALRLRPGPQNCRLICTTVHTRRGFRCFESLGSLLFVSFPALYFTDSQRMSTWTISVSYSSRRWWEPHSSSCSAAGWSPTSP